MKMVPCGLNVLEDVSMFPESHTRRPVHLRVGRRSKAGGRFARSESEHRWTDALWVHFFIPRYYLGHENVLPGASLNSNRGSGASGVHLPDSWRYLEDGAHLTGRCGHDQPSQEYASHIRANPTFPGPYENGFTEETQWNGKDSTVPESHTREDPTRDRRILDLESIDNC